MFFKFLRKHWLMTMILLVILWFCRSFFPMVFLWGAGTTITFHLPSNIELDDVSGSYYSTHCKEYWLGTNSWANMRKHHLFSAKKIALNQYQVKVYFKDYSLCQWKLESFSWWIKYKDVNKEFQGNQLSTAYIGNGAGRSKYMFRYDKFIKENQPSGTETYYITEHFYPELKTYAKGDYVTLEPYKNHNEGKYGLNTKHIDYTFVLDEPPEVEVSEE